MFQWANGKGHWSPGAVTHNVILGIVCYCEQNDGCYQEFTRISPAVSRGILLLCDVMHEKQVYVIHFSSWYWWWRLLIAHPSSNLYSYSPLYVHKVWVTSFCLSVWSYCSCSHFFFSLSVALSVSPCLSLTLHCFACLCLSASLVCL